MNFLPENATGAGFIETSLTLLRQECPQAYELLCAQMAGRTIRMLLDGEAITIAFDQRPNLPAACDPSQPCVHLTTDAHTILALADARLAVLDAILAGRLDLRGEAGELAIFYEALLTYLRGAVRCPSFPPLLDQFRLAHSG